MPNDGLHTDEEVSTALRLQALELGQNNLRTDLAENTAATRELLEAWQGSQWLLGLVKGGALLTIALAGAYAAVLKLRGH